MAEPIECIAPTVIDETYIYKSMNSVLYGILVAILVYIGATNLPSVLNCNQVYLGMLLMAVGTLAYSKLLDYIWD